MILNRNFALVTGQRVIETSKIDFLKIPVSGVGEIVIGYTKAFCVVLNQKSAVAHNHFVINKKSAHRATILFIICYLINSEIRMVGISLH